MAYLELFTDLIYSQQWRMLELWTKRCTPPLPLEALALGGSTPRDR